MTEKTVTDQPTFSWLASWRVYLQPASLRMLFLGFAAGLPLLLVLGTLSFRLREAGIDRSTIGYLSWVGLAYGFKWVWAPLVDRMPIPFLTHRLGRRRSWLLLAQAMVMLGLVGMALSDPAQTLGPVVWCALLVAVGSATQDIALDAFRIESADPTQQAALAASYQTGYRLAMIWAGAGVLWVAAWVQGENASGYMHAAWQTAYPIRLQTLRQEQQLSSLRLTSHKDVVLHAQFAIHFNLLELRVDLCLPKRALDWQTPSASAKSSETSGQPAGWSRSLQHQLYAKPVESVAVLCEKELSVAQLLSLCSRT